MGAAQGSFQLGDPLLGVIFLVGAGLLVRPGLLAFGAVLLPPAGDQARKKIVLAADVVQSLLAAFQLAPDLELGLSASGSFRCAHLGAHLEAGRQALASIVGAATARSD